jgi:heat shock protein HslJ
MPSADPLISHRLRPVSGLLTIRVLAAVAVALWLVGCAMPETEPERGAESAGEELAGTAWEMVRIQSMDDRSWSPEDSSRYTLEFDADGSAYMALGCNRGSAAWLSERPGHLEFSPVASTRALCRDDGLSERYAMQFEYVRSYVFRDGHLFLATYADGAIIEFRPAD